MRTKQQRAFSEADKAAWRAAKQQRLTELGEQLKAQVSAVQDSDDFKRYLAGPGCLSSLQRPQRVPDPLPAARGE